MTQGLTKNEIVRMTVTDVASDGNGVGRFGGMAVFVPITAIGDVLDVKIVKARRTHAFGIIERLITPSECRTENDCAAYRRCGGCSLRHIGYTHEVEIKARWVEESLRRIGGVDLAQITIDAAIPSPKHERYRNKAQYPVRRVGGEICAGFFAKRSHELVRIDDCNLQPVEFSAIVQIVVEFMEKNGIEPYDEATGQGILRHIFLRQAEAHGCDDERISGIKNTSYSERGASSVQLQAAGEIMLCLVINAAAFPNADKLAETLKARCPEVATLVVNQNRKNTNVIFGDKTAVIFGSGYITDTLCGIKVRLSARSFYQVNRQAAELLYKAALEYAAPAPDDILLDLYCGTGTIGLSMAHAVGEVIGVEVVPEAVLDATENAAQNNIKNARFICADAAAAAEQLQAEGVRPDIIILDPPRKGADEKLPAIIAALAPKKLVYISCDAATLARDIARLAPLGYRLERVRAVDLFPRTAHVECVAEIVSRE